MPGICPLCGSTLNLGLKFCVVCGRSTTSEESSKMGALKGSGVRQADMTVRLDDEMANQVMKKMKTPLRFRRVRSLWTQVLYILVGVSLFFCAVRFVLDLVFPGRVQRTVHGLMQSQPVAKLVKEIKNSTAPAKPKPAKKKRKRRAQH